MRRTLVFLLLVVHSAKTDVLFRDEHQGHQYVFESDHKDVEATVSQDEALELATDWAVSFYDDDSLEAANIEFRINPLRYWLVTFKDPGTDESFYAAVLPDGTIVEPEDKETIFKTPLRHPSQTAARLRRPSFQPSSSVG